MISGVAIRKSSLGRPCPDGCAHCRRFPAEGALGRHLESCSRCRDVIARNAHPNELCADGGSLVKAAMEELAANESAGGGGTVAG